MQFFSKKVEKHTILPGQGGPGGGLPCGRPCRSHNLQSKRKSVDTFNGLDVFYQIICLSKFLKTNICTCIARREFPELQLNSGHPRGTSEPIHGK